MKIGGKSGSRAVHLAFSAPAADPLKLRPPPLQILWPADEPHLFQPRKKSARPIFGLSETNLVQDLTHLWFKAFGPAKFFDMRARALKPIFGLDCFSNLLEGFLNNLGFSRRFLNHFRFCKSRNGSLNTAEKVRSSLRAARQYSPCGPL